MNIGTWLAIMAAQSVGPLQVSRIRFLSRRCPYSGVPVSYHGEVIGDFKTKAILSFSEGQQLRYCGSGVGYDDVIIDGNPDEMKVNH